MCCEKRRFIGIISISENYAILKVSPMLNFNNMRRQEYAIVLNGVARVMPQRARHSTTILVYHIQTFDRGVIDIRSWKKRKGNTVISAGEENRGLKNGDLYLMPQHQEL